MKPTGKLVVTIDPITALRELKGAVQRRVLRKAIRNGAKPVIDAMRALAPKDTGTLKKSIGSRVTTTRKKQVVAIIGPRRRFTRVVKGRTYTATKYRHLVEKGRKAVKIKPTKPGEERKKGIAMPIGKGIFRASAQAAPGKPFLERAAAGVTQEALDIVQRVVAQELKAEVAKAAAKARK